MSWDIVLAICLVFRKREKQEYYYKTDAEFQREQVIKHHPELQYQLVSKQYEQGLIDKHTYDKAIESLIKDIVI